MTHQVEVIPKKLLIAAGALMVGSILGVGFARTSGVGTQQSPEPVVTQSTLVRFVDEADGGVGVYDYNSGGLVHRFEREQGSFVRTTMRAVAQHRRLAGAGDELPFQLARTEEGRLLLTDGVTGLTISLESFGDENMRDFAQLLPSAGATNVE